MADKEIALLQRFAQTGDAEAFSQIVHRHAGLVYGASLRVLEDTTRAADVAQETFLQLLRDAGKITDSVPSWLHKVASRRAIDALRSDSRRKRREAKYAADKPLETTRWEDMSIFVDEGLDELDDQTRDIITQHFFQGRTATEIAEQMEISQPTVSRRIESGVAQLRQALRSRGVLVTAAALGSLLIQNTAQAAPAAVIKELGKIAIVGGAATTSAAGTSAAASATAKVATGVAAGVKAKVITATAVAAIGVGTVVTYNHVSAPDHEPQSQPKQQATAPIETPRTPTATAPAPTTPPRTYTPSIPAETTPPSIASAQPTETIDSREPVPTPPESDSQPQEQPRPSGAFGGGMMGGMGGGMGMGGYGARMAVPSEQPEGPEPEDSNEPEASSRGRTRRSNR